MAQTVYESHVSDCKVHRSAESDASRDRISELPDSLILAILSFLEMKDVVITTFISKRWNDLWTTVPCLDFDHPNRRFIEGALAKWNGAKILKLSIRIWDVDDHPTSDIFDSWLLLSIQKRVEELYAYFCAYIDMEYCAPPPLYSCSSITKLVLSDCDVKIEENVNVQWDRLKSLTIERSGYLSEDAMNRIISGAPLLEELMLFSLDIDENLNIQSTTLKMLKIGRDNVSTDIRSIVRADTELRIQAPNLLILEISGFVYSTCLLDVPSLTNAILCFEMSCDLNGEATDDDILPPLAMFGQVFRSICHAEKITLSDLSIQLLLYMEEKEMAVHFPNTKFLKLCIYAAEVEAVLDVVEMFPELTTLAVELNEENCSTLRSVRSEDDIYHALMSRAIFPGPSLQKLKTVEINWLMNEASNIFVAMEIMLQNAQVLEKMVFRPKQWSKHGCDKKLRLKARKKCQSMLKSLPNVKVIVLKPSLGGE